MPFRNYPEEKVEKEYYLRDGRNYMRNQNDPDKGNITIRPETEQPVDRLTELRRTRKEDADRAVLSSEAATPEERKRAQRRIKARENSSARTADARYRFKRIKFIPLLLIISCILSCTLLIAVVNVFVNFFNSDNIIYSTAPNADASFDILPGGSAFLFDVDFIMDVDEVVHRLVDGAMLGAILGLGVGLLLCLLSSALENKRYASFRRVRHSLERARYVICESFVKVKDNPADVFYSDSDKNKKGTLFLTKRSLEFYDSNYLTPYRNFLVKLSDITVVESKGLSKVIVYTSNGKYKFRVPVGRAKFWKRSLLHAIQNGQRSSYGR